MAENPKVSIEIAAKTDRLSADLAKAHSMFEDTSKKVSGLFSGAGVALSASLGVLVGGALFGKMIEKTIEVTREVTKLSKTLGITAEEASVLRVGLDDAFISTDDFATASSKLTKTLVKNEEAFADLGVATRDGNGNFRSTVDIMAETNSKLMEFKEGTDRNVEGMKIYGKGWDEAKKTLKLTSEVMKEAEERAEKLHLVIGDDGLKQARAYRSAMKDIGDVGESVSVQIGMALIPELTKLAVVFGDVGASAASNLVQPILKALRTIPEAVSVMTVNAAAEVDKFFASSSMAKITRGMGNGLRMMPGGQFAAMGADKLADGLESGSSSIADIESARNAQLQEIFKKYNSIDSYKSKTGDTPNRRSTGGVADKGGKDNSDILSAQAHEKYLEYLKAFAAKEIEIIKTANAMKQELARQDYELGLIDQQQFLATKLAAIEEEGKKEIEIRTAEVKKYRAEVDKYKNSTDPKDVNAYHAALVKVTTAEKELISTQSRLDMARQQNAFDQESNVIKIAANLKALNIQVLELGQNYEKAAKAKKELEQSSAEFKRLSSSEKKAKNRISGYSIAQGKISDQEYFYNQGRSRMSAIGGSSLVSGAYDAGAQYSKSMQTYEAQLKARAITEEQYRQRSLEAEKLYEDQKISMVLSAASQATDILAGQFKDSLGVQIAALAIQKTIAVAQIMMQSAVARAAATAAAMSAGVGAGPAAGAVIAANLAANLAMIETNEALAIGITVASGFVQAASLVTNSVSGARALGGPVKAGQTYLVNENRATQGPEYFTPGADGFITPADKVGGGFTQHVTIDARGSDSGVSARIQSAMRQAKEEAKAEIMSSMNRGSAFSRAVKRA